MAPAKKEPDMKTYPGRCAARLRKLRTECGMSAQDVVDQLAKKGTKVTTRAIYRWETAENEPPLSVYPLLAKLYGLKHPNELLSSK